VVVDDVERVVVGGGGVERPNARPTWSASNNARSMLSGCDVGRSGLSLAFELEPGAQKSSTSFPRSTSASVSSATTSSIPP
jgi:hypothetical protein